MAFTNFIPEIWNASMLEGFHEQAIAASLVSREYEGDATKGNTVKITTATDVAIKNYKTGSVDDGSGGTVPRTTTPDAVSESGQELLIDQEKNFDFLIDDIDRAQVAGSLDAYTRSAATGLAEDADKFIFSTAVTGAGIELDGTAPTDGNGAFDIIRDLRKALNQAHVPSGQRALVINSEFDALLVGADSKLTAVDTAGSPAGLREATLGRLLGFTVYVSENLPEVDDPFALAFYRPAVTYVSQIEKTEAMRADTSFSDRLRGLHVYGGKVIRPLGVATWSVA